jgi:hypothetical protein
MSSCLPPRSMHDSRQIYWGNPSSADSKDNANVCSVVNDHTPAAGWLLHCISLHCLCLPYSCQHRIRQLALPSASVSCCVLFLSAPASFCVVSRQPVTLRLPPSIASPAHGWFLRLPPPPSTLITVAWPLLTLRCCLPFCLSCLVIVSPLLTLLPLICRRLCLSSRHQLLSCHGLPYLLSGWLLQCLYSRRCLSSACITASHRAITYPCAMASRTSCPASFCITSAALPLGVHLQLVVMLPLPLILLVCPCLLMRFPLVVPLPLDAPLPPTTSR